MTITGTTTGPNITTSRAPRFGRVTFILPWMLVGLLTMSNVASLLSERAHNIGFGILATVANLAGQVVADTVLSSSPTKAKARAIDSVTRRLQNERTELHNMNTALRAENDAVRASKAVLTKEHDALRTIATKRASAVRALATRTTAALATRSAEAVTTLPARAAPYVGIAALVGFTTLEVKADCELAIALADLNAEHGNAPVDTGKVCGVVSMVPSPQQAWSSVKTKGSATLKTTYDVLENTANRFGLTIYSQPLK